MCVTDKTDISQDVLAFLIKHPDAQDTLEGIMQWWLLEQRIKTQTARVREALSELVEKGFIVERKGNDSRLYYRINRRRYRQIVNLLSKKFSGQS